MAAGVAAVVPTAVGDTAAGFGCSYFAAGAAWRRWLMVERGEGFVFGSTLSASADKAAAGRLQEQQAAPKQPWYEPH